MTTTSHVYEFAVSGKNDVVDAIQSIERAARNAAKATEEAYAFPLTRQQTIAAESAALERIVAQSSNASATSIGKFGAALGEVEGLVNGLARDVGVLGNETGAMVARVVGDIAGMGKAFLSGPLGIGIATATTAITLLSEGFRQLREEERAAAEAADQFAEKQRKSIDATIKAILDGRKAVTEEQMLVADIELQFARQSVDTTKESLAEAVALKEEAAKYGGEVFTDAAMLVKEITVRLAKEQAEEEAKQNEFNMLATKHNAQEKIAVARAEADVLAKIAEKQAADAAAARKKDEDALDARLKAWWARHDAQQNAEKKAREEKARADEEESARLDKLGEAADNQEAVDLQNAQRRAKTEKVVQKAIDDTTNSENKLNDATRARMQTQTKAAEWMVYSTAVNTSFETSNFLVAASLNYVSGYAREWGNINRENAREMLEINKTSIDAWAKYTQAFLFNLGLQAAQKAVMEVGEAGKEVALGFGQAALGEMAGAQMHFISAGGHMMAAKSYAAIGGVSVGASLAIGSQRGEGGLFGLGEKEKDNGGRPSSSGGPSSGSVYGGGGGGGEGPGRTVYVYFPGAVNAADDRHLRRTVARGARGAKADGFLRW